VMKTADAFSTNLTTGMVLTTLIGFALIYGLLMAVTVFLMAKYALAGPAVETPLVPPLEDVTGAEEVALG
jgi:cytochrome bd-type quinol oxidase subunit 1